MGITIVQKSTKESRAQSNLKIALVLAGGAMSGGAFKIGGLKALNDYLINKKLTDFDIYIGLSAGAILAIPLAGGIPPEEMLASLDGNSQMYSQLSPLSLYQPNLEESIERLFKFAYGYATFVPGMAYDLSRSLPRLKAGFLKNIKTFLKKPNYSNYENLTKPFLKSMFSNRKVPNFGELIPTGVFDNKPLSEYLAQNMKNNQVPNHFRTLKKEKNKSLYMTAMNLDSAENVIFGPDEKFDISISDAARASSAIPGFYKPARLKGIDYIDGGVRKTANIDLAIQKGADLVICYNPFRPYNNQVFIEYFREENQYIAKNKRLADWGLGTVINQVFRTLFHSRLEFGIQNLVNSKDFKKDIILIEPAENDSDFFTMNPLYFWNRAKAAELGFASVTESIDKKYNEISEILGWYDLKMSQDIINRDKSLIENSLHDDQVIMDVLKTQNSKKPKLQILKKSVS